MIQATHASDTSISRSRTTGARRRCTHKIEKLARQRRNEGSGGSARHDDPSRLEVMIPPDGFARLPRTPSSPRSISSWRPSMIQRRPGRRRRRVLSEPSGIRSYPSRTPEQPSAGRSKTWTIRDLRRRRRRGRARTRRRPPRPQARARRKRPGRGIGHRQRLPPVPRARRQMRMGVSTARRGWSARPRPEYPAIVDVRAFVAAAHAGLARNCTLGVYTETPPAFARGTHE